MTASYLQLYKNGTLKKITDEFLSRLESCDICPRKCRVNRLRGEKGYCQTGRFARVSSFFRHFGEEPPLVGSNGSGTLFFSYCNLKCVFCQNHSLSHFGEGYEQEPLEMADHMIQLQKEGAHNINFVTPTHVIPQILESLLLACEKGLNIPLVYNTGGYDSPDVIKKLANIFDIYLPDMKYFDQINAKKYSDAPDYKNQCFPSISEMQNQVGTLIKDKSGVALKGLMIRHLVLPGEIAGSKNILAFIAEHLPKETYINIMDQYHPCYKAYDYPELSSRIKHFELNELIKYAKEIGLTEIDY